MKIKEGKTKKQLLSMLKTREKKIEERNNYRSSLPVGYMTARQDWKYFQKSNELQHEIEQINSMLKGEVYDGKLKTYEGAFGDS